MPHPPTSAARSALSKVSPHTARTLAVAVKPGRAIKAFEGAAPLQRQAPLQHDKGGRGTWRWKQGDDQNHGNHLEPMTCTAMVRFFGAPRGPAGPSASTCGKSRGSLRVMGDPPRNTLPTLRMQGGSQVGQGVTTMMFWYVPILISPLWMGMDSEVPRTKAMRWEWALTGSLLRNSRHAASPPGQLGGPTCDRTRP